MDNNKQTIHYCTVMSAEQWIFLLDSKVSIDRHKCLYKLMADAVRSNTAYNIKGIEIVLEVGQVAASDVELATYLGCNRKTVGKLIDSFNRLGMLTTRTNNRTSIHTLHFLAGWYADGVLTANPHYVKPSVVHSKQKEDVRTPNHDKPLSEYGQDEFSQDSNSEKPQVDSMGMDTAIFSSSLCLSENSDQSENGMRDGCRPSHHNLFAGSGTNKYNLMDDKDRPNNGNDGKGNKEAQDATFGNPADP